VLSTDRLGELGNGACDNAGVASLALEVQSLQQFLWDSQSGCTPQENRAAIARAITRAFGIAVGIAAVIYAITGHWNRLATIHLLALTTILASWFLSLYAMKQTRIPLARRTKEMMAIMFAGNLFLHTHAPVRAALNRCAQAAIELHNQPVAREHMERAFEAAGPFIRWDGVSYQDFKRTVAIDPDATEAVARIGKRSRRCRGRPNPHPNPSPSGRRAFEGYLTGAPSGASLSGWRRMAPPVSSVAANSMPWLSTPRSLAGLRL